MEKLPGGLWPVMITPFDENNKIDQTGLKKLVDMYLDAGANGFFANCLSNEMFQLTDEERLQLTRIVVDHSNGRVPVAATGTFYSESKKNAEFIRKIYDQGAKVVILISSVLVEPAESDDVLKKKIEEIMELTGDIPLGMYECPVPYKRVISPAIMKWMAESGRFWYHKDTSCDAQAIRKKLQEIKGTNFQLYNADTPSALDSLRDGGMGISPISGNFYPELYAYFLKLFYEGKNKELEELYAQLIVMDKVTHSFYPYASKVFLRKRGLNINTNTRIPMEKMTVKDVNILNGLMDMFLKIARDHSIKLVI